MTVAQKKSSQTVTVVVTAVGAIIGQGVVTSLRNSQLPLRIIGVDREPNGIGRYWCDDFFAKPTHDESSVEYLNFWEELLLRENVALVLPGLEGDVLFFNRNRTLFDRTPSRVVLNDPKLIELAHDKWNMGEELRRAGLPAILSTLSRDWDQCLQELGPPPLLLKPRCANGSRGISILRDKDDFVYWSGKSEDEFLIQKFIGSAEQEYTVGAFGLGDGNVVAPIVFRRKLSAAGNTQYAEIVDEPFLFRVAEDISRLFNPLGPTNYQFRIADHIPYILEINPRFSSSTSLRAAFGYNEAAMALEFYLHGKIPDVPKINAGRAWRYYEDLVVR